MKVLLQRAKVAILFLGEKFFFYWLTAGLFHFTEDHPTINELLYGRPLPVFVEKLTT